MNREIKYRAWLKDEKVMVNVEEIDFYNNTIAYIFDNYAEVEQEWIEEDIQNVELLQYTGLTDTNGIEIYEGDIVKVTNDEGETNFVDGGIGSVGNMGDLFMWYIDGQVQNGLYDIDRSCYIEVIGNIFENPELLEETK